MLDRNLFSQMMMMLCEVYNRQQTKPLMEAYYLVLKQMSDDDFKSSMINLLENRTFQALPKPAEILEYSKPNTEAIATLALQDVERAIARGGRNMSLIFDDKVVHSVIEALGGWVYICDMSKKEWEFKRKEFTRLYDVQSKRTDHPDHVAGLAEKTSGLADGQTGHFARVKAGYEVKQQKPVKALNPVSTNVMQLANMKRVEK